MSQEGPSRAPQGGGARWCGDVRSFVDGTHCSACRLRHLSAKVWRCSSEGATALSDRCSAGRVIRSPSSSSCYHLRREGRCPGAAATSVTGLALLAVRPTSAPARTPSSRTPRCSPIRSRGSSTPGADRSGELGASVSRPDGGCQFARRPPDRSRSPWRCSSRGSRAAGRTPPCPVARTGSPCGVPRPHRPAAG